jgi:hypothetical protein
MRDKLEEAQVAAAARAMDKYGGKLSWTNLARAALRAARAVQEQQTAHARVDSLLERKSDATS